MIQQSREDEIKNDRNELGRLSRRKPTCAFASKWQYYQIIAYTIDLHLVASPYLCEGALLLHVSLLLLLLLHHHVVVHLLRVHVRRTPTHRHWRPHRLKHCSH